MSAFLRFHALGGDREAFLVENQDLRDLLEPMLVDGDAPPEDVTDTVLGDFRLEREIGRGGSGVVYAARQISLGRSVAVKVLPRQLLLSPSTIARFRREAKTIAALSHPGIVRVLAIGCDQHTHWFAMELIEGRSLAAHLADLRRREPPAAWTRRMVQLAAHVADALHYVHQLGILHRDVKPSNVLLRHDSTPVLTDFGLARDDNAPTLTLPGGRAGTPCYMAPEQFADAPEEIDARCDVFALGATLHEMLTFERAFDASSPDLAMRRVLDEEPPDPRKRNPAVSRDLAAVVATALAKDPARRYQSAAELADDLRAVLGRRAVRARSPGALARLGRWARRRPLRATMAVFAAVGLPALAALLAFVAARAPLVRAGEQRQLEDLIDQGFYFTAHSDRDYPKAQQALDAVLRLAPENPEALVAMTLMLGRWRGYEAALAFLDGRPELCAQCRELRWARALCLRVLQRFDEAQLIEAALGEAQDAVEHLLAASIELVDSDAISPERKRRALYHISLASRLSPRPRLMIAINFADVADLVGDSEAREEAVATLTTLWPDSSRAWGTVAWVLRRVDPPRAKHAIDRALALYPGEQGLLMARGVILEQMGDRAGALRDLEPFRACNLAEVHEALCRLHANER